MRLHLLLGMCVYIDWQKWRARIVHSSRIACLLMKVCEYAATPTLQTRGLCVCFVCTSFHFDVLIVSVSMCVLTPCTCTVCLTVRERLGNHINNQLQNENDPQQTVCTQSPPSSCHMPAVIKVCGSG